jgi:hypothetical protein
VSPLLTAVLTGVAVTLLSAALRPPPGFWGTLRVRLRLRAAQPKRFDPHRDRALRRATRRRARFSARVGARVTAPVQGPWQRR